MSDICPCFEGMRVACVKVFNGILCKIMKFFQTKHVFKTTPPTPPPTDPRRGVFGGALGPQGSVKKSAPSPPSPPCQLARRGTCLMSQLKGSRGSGEDDVRLAEGVAVSGACGTEATEDVTAGAPSARHTAPTPWGHATGQ